MEFLLKVSLIEHDDNWNWSYVEFYVVFILWLFLWASCCTVRTLVKNRKSATTAACHVSYIDNLAYILQHLSGHSQQWQRFGSLRFDSAKSLWTWRAIWPLMSGSGVAGSRSGRPQPQPETDLWPAVGRPPTGNKTDPRTEGSHYTAVALPLVVWSASAVHMHAGLR